MDTPHTDPTGADAAEAPAPESAPNGADHTAPSSPSAALTHEDAPIDVETLVATLESVTAERDSHLADLQRVSAEFANFRKQAAKRQSDTVAHAASGLAEKLLPVLDACEAAVTQGAVDVEPVHTTLVDILRKEGLEKVSDAGAAFDPERHEAVVHEAGEGEPVVADVLRAGYVWNGRVLRPAMVRVQG